MPPGAMCVQNFDESRFCNSHYVSHFAAFFIDARAKRSIAESCLYFFSEEKKQLLKKTTVQDSSQSKKAAFFKCRQFRSNNDPSAGSPTETLLRLLLPLDDQV